MRLYSRPSWQLARQLVGDLALLAWVAGCALAGRQLARAIEALAGPARRTAEVAGRMSEQMGRAGSSAGQVPMLGDELAQPFTGVAQGLGDIVAQADQQVVLIHRLSLLTGWLCFLIPALAAMVWWLPRRVRFARRATAAQRFIDSDQDLDLFALRAMATMPMDQLARISPDPVGQWRAGNRDVINRLADLELRRNGLSRPRRRR